MKTTRRPADCTCLDYDNPNAPCVCGAADARRARKLARLAFALGAALGVLGCVHAPATVTVEAVGQLAQGPSVYSAPVHPDTDLSIHFQAIDTDDAPATVASSPAAPAEAPEVTRKDGAIKMGEVR